MPGPQHTQSLQSAAPVQQVSPELPLPVVVAMGICAGNISAELVHRLFFSTTTTFDYDLSLLSSILKQGTMGAFIASTFSIKKAAFFTSAAVGAGYTLWAMRSSPTVENGMVPTRRLDL